MEQINTYAIFLLGKWLDSAFLSARWPIKSNVGAWQSARTLLDILLSGEARFRLNESAVAANQLRQVIDTVLAVHQSSPESTLADQLVQSFNSAWSAFEQALALDLSRAPIFFVRPKGIFATPMLIMTAEAAVVDEVAQAISEVAKKDLNQAGRCLAFELGTASAYHSLRAVEKVLREYYEVVLKKPSGRLGMKHCIDKLRAAGADAKTLAVLDQLRDLHRNPIDHPEVFLGLPEAMELFSVCTSAISAMGRQIKALKT